MPSISDAYTQLGSISAVPGGFAFAFISVLLTRAEATRASEVTAAVVIPAAACFTLCALGWTGAGVWLAQTAAAGRPIADPQTLRVLAIHGPRSFLFTLGTLLFLATMGPSGWLHSRRLGIYSSAVAVLALGLAFSLLGRFVSVN